MVGGFFLVFPLRKRLQETLVVWLVSVLGVKENERLARTVWAPVASEHTPDVYNDQPLLSTLRTDRRSRLRTVDGHRITSLVGDVEVLPTLRAVVAIVDRTSAHESQSRTPTLETENEHWRS